MSESKDMLVSDEDRENLRRRMTSYLYPSNPDMGGREFYRLGIGHQRRIDTAINLMLEFSQTELSRLRSELQSVLDSWNEMVKASGAKTNGTAIGHVARLRAERDEALGVAKSIVSIWYAHGVDKNNWTEDQAGVTNDLYKEGVIDKARALLSKHSKEGQEVTG